VAGAPDRRTLGGANKPRETPLPDAPAELTAAQLVSHRSDRTLTAAVQARLAHQQAQAQRAEAQHLIGAVGTHYHP